MQRQILFSQIGARHHYQFAEALHSVHALALLCTDMWVPYSRWYWPSNCKALPAISRMNNRYNKAIPQGKVLAFLALAIRYNLKLQMCQNNFEISSVLAKFGREFAARQRKLDHVAHDVFIGLCSESLEMLRFEKERHRLTAMIQYDAANDSDLIREEEALWPDWKRDSGSRCEEYYARVYEEWQCVDVIIANSEWTRSRIVKQGAPAEKIVVIPHPFKDCDITGAGRRGLHGNSPLKVLYVGSVSVRKGVQYLIDAARQLPMDRFQFTLVGRNSQSEGLTKSFPDNVEVVGEKPYSELRRYYASHDVLVFPTISDGFGRVQLEAMAHGLPVISSQSCGDVVTNGLDGFRVRPSDSTAIAEALRQIEGDHRLLANLSDNALRKAKEFSLDLIGKQILEALDNHKSIAAG